MTALNTKSEDVSIQLSDIKTPKALNLNRLAGVYDEFFRRENPDLTNSCSVFADCLTQVPQSIAAYGFCFLPSQARFSPVRSPADCDGLTATPQTRLSNFELTPDVRSTLKP